MKTTYLIDTQVDGKQTQTPFVLQSNDKQHLNFMLTMLKNKVTKLINVNPLFKAANKIELVVTKQVYTPKQIQNETVLVVEVQPLKP